MRADSYTDASNHQDAVENFFRCEARTVASWFVGGRIEKFREKVNEAVGDMYSDRFKMWSGMTPKNGVTVPIQLWLNVRRVVKEASRRENASPEVKRVMEQIENWKTGS